MKTLILLLSLLFAQVASGTDVAGQWISKPTGRFTEFRTDGTFFGDGFGSNITIRNGNFELLQDGSGIIIYNDDTPVLMDIRELTDTRMVLSFHMTAIVFERATPEEIREKRRVLSETERKEEYIRNLITIVRAGQQYMREQGVPSVSYRDLAGLYFDDIEPIHGESYRDLEIHAAGGKISVRNRSGEDFEYLY